MSYRDYDLGEISSSSSGLDSFLGDKSSTSLPKTARVKVASLDQLEGFVRTASDTLIHKSDKDLWSLQKDANGDYYIERLFDGDAPLKG